MKTSKAQQIRIEELTEKFGMNEEMSGMEKETDGTYFFYFKSAYGNGYATIQEYGEVTGGNLGYYEAL